TFSPRAHGVGPHRDVDDTPYGGGAGMVMRADVLAAAIDAAALTLPADAPRLLMSPRGRPLTQQRVEHLAAGPGVMLVCGRFEGVDERVIAGRGLEEISVGDFVLSGGEPAALIVLDAVVRLLPGVMGKAVSHREESFQPGIAGDPDGIGLEHPQFTKPRTWEGAAVPDVLLTGDHARIAAWRRAQALRLTRARRPDLLD
ncbi:MAG: tRNA (guanosine(37)-N1)-methyltransferase TrmD, partial [Pseudomonadota bacterium]